MTATAKIEYLRAQLVKAENAAAFAVNPQAAKWPKALAEQIRWKLEQLGAA